MNWSGKCECSITRIEHLLAAMAIDEATIRLAARTFCFPMTLVINFSLFQYLVTFHYKRRREPLGILLMGSALVGFVALLPFAMHNAERFGHLNDVSETCTVLTFLVQITITGRDIERKVRIPVLRFVTRASELLMVLDLFVIVENIVEASFPSLDMSMFDSLDNIAEDISLAFIFASRFVFLAMTKGVRQLFKTKKLELLMYTLFVTHEYPFLLLYDLTGVSWEDVQALWHRVTTAMCIMLTIHARFKISSAQPRNPHTTTAGSKAPSSLDPVGPEPSTVVGHVDGSAMVRNATILQINTTEMMEDDELFCMPVTMLINFCLFQYILTLYWKRRRELRVFLLIMCAFVSFAVLVPFAMPEDEEDIVGHLNDISETCSALTFLMQITLLGHDAQRKSRIRSLRVMLLLAELLELFGIFVIGLNLVKIATSSTLLTKLEFLDNTMEDTALAFIFIFRFYCVWLFRGWKKMVQTQKLEMMLYLLFMTHEYPFMLLAKLSNANWELVQGLWNRLTILMCVLVTIHDRLISSRSSKNATSGFSHAPNGEIVKGPKTISAGVRKPHHSSTKGPSASRTSPSTVVSVRSMTQRSMRKLRGDKVTPTPFLP
ncbi:TPA: hypothetical protein N0F65_006319 [Lagenidium giganteum]|uniref:Uncharacterized protein n=1 Tax=Lagenidium giganteum TaxID=4803 RepID=A0AAV2YS08_9STRA|nr:TPA: hypothetical protein N0F65_006319 [Lagenidium giganteum]